MEDKDFILESVRNLRHWEETLRRVADFFNCVLGYLKDSCLEKDSIVNCNETWCRVKVTEKYSKRYVWCLVNWAVRVIIYYYEDGSRGRKVLKNILEGRELHDRQQPRRAVC